MRINELKGIWKGMYEINVISILLRVWYTYMCVCDIGDQGSSG